RVFDLAQNSILAVRAGGRGDVTETHVVWSYDRGLPYVPSPVAYRGNVYLVKDSGIATILDGKTGTLLAQGRARGRGNYYASPVAGDGKVYLTSEQGVVTILAAGGTLETLGSHDFGERILATPVIADGQMY